MIRNRSECTGCFACKQICPVEAIEMSLDDSGFMIPIINNKCIACNLCEKVCPIEKPLPQRKHSVFSFINNNKESLMHASSGGLFAALAEYIIEQNGIVFGCVLDDNNHAKHVSGTTKESVRKMQGSKYVQSYVGNTYIEAKKYLNQGRKVLFSGTPCQIDGLYNYLGKDYTDLITVDIICHGVPNQEMLDREIERIEDSARGTVKEVLFRDKRINGWNLIGSVKIGNRRKIFFPANSPYYYYFDKGSIYRNSCYSCKYANMDRVGDITIGDFWGIENSKIEKASIIGRGVSLVISNSSKGLDYIRQLEDKGQLRSNDIANALRENVQLASPVPCSRRDEVAIELYHTHNMLELMNKYIKETRLSKFIMTMKAFVPVGIKLKIKGMRNHEK